MTYNELLQQKEWWTKCNEILSRDHYTCRNCGCLGYHNGGNFMKLNSLEELDTLLKGWVFNSMPLSKFCSNIPNKTPYPFKGIVFVKEYSVQDLTVYRLNLLVSVNKLFPSAFNTPERFIVISRERLEVLNAKVYCLQNISRRDNSLKTVGTAYFFEFPCIISNEIHVNIEYELIGTMGLQKFEVNMINITFGNKLLTLRYHPVTFPLKGLNVHHTYYIKGHKPWEYENDSLVTLCEDCHRKRHEGTAVPLLNDNKELVANLATCPRCGGSGYLPQYSHVEHGICFKCNGEGVILNDW